jgi:hypothetical protein
LTRLRLEGKVTDKDKEGYRRLPSYFGGSVWGGAIKK